MGLGGLSLLSQPAVVGNTWILLLERALVSAAEVGAVWF